MRATRRDACTTLSQPRDQQQRARRVGSVARPRWAGPCDQIRALALQLSNPHKSAWVNCRAYIAGRCGRSPSRPRANPTYAPGPHLLRGLPFVRLYIGCTRARRFHRWSSAARYPVGFGTESCARATNGRALRVELGIWKAHRHPRSISPTHGVERPKHPRHLSVTTRDKEHSRARGGVTRRGESRLMLLAATCARADDLRPSAAAREERSRQRPRQRPRRGAVDRGYRRGA